MSARLSLLALSTLLLSACDGNPLQTDARQTACCCDHCPTSAAPAGKPGRAASTGETTRVVASDSGAATYHRRTTPGVRVAAATSSRVMRACACGLRSTAACNMRGTDTSSTYCPRPASSRLALARGNDAPM